MPQEFHVLRCYSCSIFQVHIVKKVNKWQCKVCNEKQSVKKVYGEGSSKDCRNHVQRLNSLQLAADQEASDVSVQHTSSVNIAVCHSAGEEQTDPPSQEFLLSGSSAQTNLPQAATSKWSQYVQPKEPRESSSEEELFATCFEQKKKKNGVRKKKSQHLEEQEDQALVGSKWGQFPCPQKVVRNELSECKKSFRKQTANNLKTKGARSSKWENYAEQGDNFTDYSDMSNQTDSQSNNIWSVSSKQSYNTYKVHEGNSVKKQKLQPQQYSQDKPMNNDPLQQYPDETRHQNQWGNSFDDKNYNKKTFNAQNKSIPTKVSTNNTTMNISQSKWGKYLCVNDSGDSDNNEIHHNDEETSDKLECETQLKMIRDIQARVNVDTDVNTVMNGVNIKGNVTRKQSPHASDNCGEEVFVSCSEKEKVKMNIKPSLFRTEDLSDEELDELLQL